MARSVVIAMLALCASAAAASDQDKEPKKRIECEKRDPAKPREPGLLRFEDLAWCPERTPFPWENCGDCGFLNRWDDRLQIWRQPGQ